MNDFEEIYVEYFSAVNKYVLSLCRDELLAEEITQETFFKALRKIDQFKNQCKLYVWLCQIAKNTYYSHIKKKKQTVSEADSTLVDISMNIEGAFLDKEAAKNLHALLHNLAEPYKEVFTLRVFGELSYSQIGGLFGKRDSWARLIYYRAKKQLWEAMK
ncbi:MAG: RNA polymerase sigma factor [Lachnospiraceae bacterium]